MFVRSIRWLLILVTLSGVHAAQDKKPADGKAKPKPFEATVLGRRVSLTPGDAWSEYAPAAMELAPDAAPWKLAGAWKSRKYEELTLRLFGVESAGATSASVRDTWFELARSKGTPGILVRADVTNPKDKTLRGHDLEADFKSGDEKAYCWIRVLDIGKDKVAVLLSEARPLKPREMDAEARMETFAREQYVLEIQPILASFMQPNAKPEEAWIRGPIFDISRGERRITVDSPRGWLYSRREPEGAVIWTAPGDSGCDVAVEFAGNSAVMMQVERDLVAQTGGRLVQDRAITTPAAGQEMITAMTGFGRTAWSWRRIFQMGDLWLSVDAKVFVKDVSASPSAEVQKAFEAFHGSVRIGK
jgi:hypothetical protein